MDLLDQWYATAGRALHVEGRKPHRPEVAEELVAEMGLDPGTVKAAIADPTTGDEVLAEHRASWARAASACPPSSSTTARPCSVPCWSTPRPAPRHSACGTWSPAGSSSRTSTNCNGRRARADIDAIAQAFAPYLEARDWFSVQRETP